MAFVGLPTLQAQASHLQLDGSGWQGLWFEMEAPYSFKFRFREDMSWHGTEVFHADRAPAAAALSEHMSF